MNITVHALPDEFSVGFGEYIAHLREKQNISIEELANQINISTLPLKEIEKGEYIPSIEELEPLAAPLGTTYANLLFQAGYNEEMFNLMHAI